MRCPGCNKFPSVDAGDPEVDITIDGDRITGNIRLPQITQCCGEECKEYNFEVDCLFDEPLIAALKEAGIEAPDLHADGVEIELTDEYASSTDRFETKGKAGRPVAVSRAKHLFGYELTMEIHCTYPVPGKEFKMITLKLSHADEVPSGEFEEL